MDDEAHEREPEPPSVAEFETPRPSLRPMLASEALIEDLAPLEPARSAARLWTAGVGALVISLGVSDAFFFEPPRIVSAIVAWFSGIVAISVASLSLDYTRRALALAAMGAVIGAMGLASAGPLHHLGQIDGGWWGALRYLAATVLPAALFFRARYRAYPRARRILAMSLLLALPFAFRSGFHLVDAGFVWQSAGNACVLLAFAMSLSGFLGAETTAAGSFTAAAIIAASSLDLLVSQFDPALFELQQGALMLGQAMAFGGVCAMTAFGIFQLLASRFAAEARQIDLHAKAAEPRASNPSGEWSTRR